MRRPLAALAAAVLLASLTACSSPTPAATHTVKAAPSPAPAITGAALAKIDAWGECQQLVRKKLQAKPDQLVVFTHQSTSGTAARMVAVGEASFSSTPAWSYRCVVGFDGDRITSRALSMGVL